MEESIAKNAIVFLQRVDLKGSEAGSFNEVMVELSKYANLNVPKPPTPEEFNNAKRQREKAEKITEAISAEGK